MGILVVAAHPDDETLGAGGTMARLSENGHTVNCLILGEVTTSRVGTDDPTGDVDEVRSECRHAASTLGVDQLVHGTLPDNRFDQVPLLEIVRLIEEQLRRLTPSTVLTHSNADLNIDHLITHRAVLTATRPAPGSSVGTVAAFEVPSSTEWNHTGPSFRPNVFVDISATLDVKLRALQCYRSEARDFPHPRSTEAVRALAVHRGATAGLDAAEGFELIRSIVPIGSFGL